MPPPIKVPESDIFNRILDLFDRQNWPYEYVGGDTARILLGSTKIHFSTLVHYNNHWVVITINPLIKNDPTETYGLTFLSLLAQFNHLAKMAKVGLDPVGDVFITVEIPVENFHESHIKDALAAIAHYAEDLYLASIKALHIDRSNLKAAAKNKYSIN